MALADSKKRQTFINLMHDEATTKIAEANAAVQKMKNVIVDNGLQGQFSPGELSVLTAFVADVATAAASPAIPFMASRYVPSHRSQAIRISGVND